MGGTIDRNKLRLGASALFNTQSSGEEADVKLPRRGGRPEKGDTRRWSRKNEKVTTIVLDPDQHEYLKRLSIKTGVTFKEIMFRFLEDSIRRYKEGMISLAPDDEE